MAAASAVTIRKLDSAELTDRLDALEELSAAIINPDEYGTYSRADAIDAEALVLVRAHAQRRPLWTCDCCKSITANDDTFVFSLRQRDRARWLTKHVCKELAKRKLSLTAAFARFDRRKTGRLTSASLLRGLRALDIAVDTVAYDMLLLAFRKDRRGAFTEEEFCTHFEQISHPDTKSLPMRRRATKPSSKGGAEGILERLREQDESKEKPATRGDGLPERKRRSDGTPATLAEFVEESSHIDGDSAAETKQADAYISTTLDALQREIEEVMQDGTSNSQEQKSKVETVADTADEADSQRDDRDDSEGTSMDPVACAGRRMALDLPRASGAGCGRPSLLLRMPYSTLLTVSQQLPRASRVSLCISCRELCRLLGRGPGGRWATEAAALRQVVFDGWSASFFDNRAMRRLQSERKKQKESKQREEQEVREAASQIFATSPLI